jgi:hypothetical protein
MIETYHTILQTAESEGLDLILIGGHAVNALGYERTTLDLDFMAISDYIEKWERALALKGFQSLYKTEAFIQFALLSPDSFRVDLMFVDALTFSKIASASQTVRYGNALVRIPCVLHLIALKLHAMKNPAREKLGKDYNDIKALILRHGIDVLSDEFQNILNRYASPTVRSKLMQNIHE